MREGTARIPTYLSHSYRSEDRAINRSFWNLFWKAGFAFTVAPQSGNFSMTHLELMMRRSSCFVGIATHRPEVGHYLTSAYVVYEYGMAVLADRPRLVFVESGVAGRYFEPSRMMVFRRGDIGEEDGDDAAFEAPPRWRHAIDLLHEMSVSHAHEDDRTLGSVGLLLPRAGCYRALAPEIRELLNRAGYDVVDIDYESTGNLFQLILDVDRHDFVLIALDAGTTPSWLYPLLTGRFVPMIRLLHRDDGEGSDVSEPGALLGHAMGLTAGGKLTISWSEREQLIHQLEREVEELKRPRAQFSSFDEGRRYFNSLGRATGGAVFVSNAAPENVFAQQLSRLFDINNIPFFHYVYRNTIQLGAPWSERLRGHLQTSQLFVPLITNAYWDSDVCRQEYELAEQLSEAGRLKIFPYFLEDLRGTSPGVRLQGRTLHGLPLGQQLSEIVKDVDKEFTSGAAEPGQPPR
jgi:hypothetical protein